MPWGRGSGSSSSSSAALNTSKRGGEQSETVSERMKNLLTSGRDADVNFLVGEKKELMPAHKLILSTASTVFEAMFRFDNKNSKARSAKMAGAKEKAAKSGDEATSTVEVSDVEPMAFRIMLNFVYADETSELNGDNLFAVLYTAKKYSVDGLVKACIYFPNLDKTNVFTVLGQARFYDEEELIGRCLGYIDWNAADVIGSKEFQQIEPKLLCELLDRDTLFTGEKAIWDAALKWADEHCREGGMEECTGENRRLLLGPALFKVRFPLMPQSEFAANIVPSGVLTKEELLGVFIHYSKPAFGSAAGRQPDYPLKFPSRRREEPPPPPENAAAAERDDNDQRQPPNKFPRKQTATKSRPKFYMQK